MVIDVLDENVIAQIRSSSVIDSVTQCVTELVLNSLDAKATAVAIRVNLATFRIQVVDNGRGISRANLESVGLRYMTTKCHSLSDFKKRIKFYGFKGEALASVSNVSRRVCITTREHECEDTYEKTIEKDESTVEVTKMRPSGGTTVTVEGFLSNLPVRQQCIKNNEFESIRRSVESLVIIHPRVSFTLRNELGGKVLLASVKCPDIASSFKTIHPNVDENEFDFFRVTKSETSVEGLIHKELGENKRLQYIYVNKRPINCPKIQQLINTHFKNAKTRGNDRKKTCPIFVIHIKCPYSDVDISLESTKTVVFFKKFDIVKQCIDKMMTAVLGKGDVELVEKKPRKEMSEFGVSQIGGAVKGVGTKRKSTMLEEIAPSKSPKIVDDTPCCEKPREVTKQTKRALPIEIRKSDKKEVCESRWDFGGVGDNTLCTNFPENEQKGKDVIMDMFMMSLKVFPEENKRPESLEQNGDGFEIPNKVTMGVQTTLDEPPTRENMISVGVQAGPSNIQIVDSNFTFFPRRPFKTYVSDYDFDFSKVDAFPRFDKQYKNDLGVFNCFDQTRKLFDFRNHHPGPVDAFPDYNQDCFSYLRDSFFGGNGVLEDERVDSVIPTIHFEKPLPRKKAALRGVELVQRSPYFLKKFLTKQVKERPNEGRDMNCGCQNEPEMGSRDGLEDTASYCSHKDQGKKVLGSKNLEQVEMTFVRREEGKVNLDETTISKYFSPRRIESGKKINFQLRIGGKSSNPQSLDESRDLFNFLSQNRYEGKDKERIANKDLECEKQMGQEIISPTLTQPQMDWIEKVDKSGANNLRLASPKKDMTFEITERFDFVPKGLSPILKDFGKVPVLSPESREHLQNAVIQSYDDELLVVKWQNYITTKDPKKFFEEIYLAKSKLIEGSIPNVSKSGYAKHAVQNFENMSFTKSLFKNLEMIGQVDCKFIAVLEKTKKLILLFDQHAVHERVRLEQLCESYKSASMKLDQDVTIFLPHKDVSLLKRQKTHLNSLGLVVSLFTNGVTVSEVPLCLYNKSKKGTDIVFLTETLIKEVIETLKVNNGIIVNTPRVIQDIVNSEACRGAIKFGDSLSKNECLMHLKTLSECTLPFQCAHGRPTLTPLISLDKFYDTLFTKPQLHNLK